MDMLFVDVTQVRTADRDLSSDVSEPFEVVFFSLDRARLTERSG